VLSASFVKSRLNAAFPYFHVLASFYATTVAWMKCKSRTPSSKRR
jgi:hypothetical protein